MSKALYRKYRSKSLQEIIGQKHITDILSRAIANNHISHAYLLTGPRGVGKTSVARILAHQINHLDYDEDKTNLDIIEIDAASNNGVEDVRDLREKIQIAPVSASKKVYIIDEVHMLSKAAFNALLKTLEEPPEHIVFILATTDADKLPSTIISRTQRFNFRPINIEDMVNHLSYIAKKEKIKISKEALRLIAERGDGSFRDSISLLDQISDLFDNDNDIISEELAQNALGLAPHQLINDLIEAIESKNIESVVKLLDRANSEGISAISVSRQLINKLYETIIDKPHLISLIDSLIDVEKSPQPYLKLLSVLGLATNSKSNQKTIALLSTKKSVSAPLSKLEEIAISKDHDFKPRLDNFKWNELIDYTKANYIALYSVLSKCRYELDGSTLKIYTNSTFYKKKLDDIKYSSLLNKCLIEIGYQDIDIHTIPTNIPPKNSKAAAIVAIMGGGEEVSLDPI
ncbi:MAG: DNA polymerase III subunit gamma/tau [Candidatus Saccharimonadales bacterium]